MSGEKTNNVTQDCTDTQFSDGSNAKKYKYRDQRGVPPHHVRFRLPLRVPPGSRPGDTITYRVDDTYWTADVPKELDANGDMWPHVEIRVRPGTTPSLLVQDVRNCTLHPRNPPLSAPPGPRFSCAQLLGAAPPAAAPPAAATRPPRRLPKCSTVRPSCCRRPARRARRARRPARRARRPARPRPPPGPPPGASQPWRDPRLVRPPPPRSRAAAAVPPVRAARAQAASPRRRRRRASCTPRCVPSRCSVPAPPSAHRARRRSAQASGRASRRPAGIRSAPVSDGPYWSCSGNEHLGKRVLELQPDPDQPGKHRRVRGTIRDWRPLPDGDTIFRVVFDGVLDPTPGSQIFLAEDVRVLLANYDKVQKEEREATLRDAQAALDADVEEDEDEEGSAPWGWAHARRRPRWCRPETAPCTPLHDPEAEAEQQNAAGDTTPPVPARVDAAARKARARA